MTRVGILFFIFNCLLANNAFAFTCTVFPNRVEVGIGKIEESATLDVCEKEIRMNRRAATVITLSSYGGWVRDLPTTLFALDRVLQLAKQKAVGLPVVVVREYCKSACVPILAAFNQLAARKVVVLIVDSKTVIGFHGASIPRDSDGTVAKDDQKASYKEYSSLGTFNYLHIFSIFGASIPWLVDHAELFVSDEKTEMFPEDPRLDGSNILDQALIRNTNFFFYGYPNFNMNPSNFPGK